MIYFVEIDDKVVYSWKGSVELTNKEFYLFMALINNAINGEKIDRDNLLSSIWPEKETTISNNNIHQLFSRLKKKTVIISDDLELQSSRGKFYRINNKKKISVHYISHNSTTYKILRITSALLQRLFKRSNLSKNISTS
ncbi:helix-turn-helix domain-containing protein [Yersinia nurmii]|uniref:Helix-turn-helix domain-containing protein n=1 Tax=Yersinia nurmii TaxID=685706 RepID=A0AAW7K171_9GAMM|nr:helix-turn-helix domain-containing protein [Yersinia nurmii]MDN0088293.1 helix-turn-helix domain-containing protein [Yersinia nurmii]CNE37974.1 Uncharacterised protein [Yersinia nurmii]